MFGELNLSGDAPQTARNRQRAIEARSGQKYGDLSEYHQLLVGLFHSADARALTYAFSRSRGFWPVHHDHFTDKEIDDAMSHIPRAFGYAPDDARMRYFVEMYARNGTEWEGLPKPDPDDVLLDELRLVVKMEPKNGAFHLILARLALNLGETKEGFSELDACGKAPYFRWPEYWPYQRIVENPPKKLSRRQFVNLSALFPQDHLPDFVRLKDFTKELTECTSLGAPISTLTSGLRSICAMGRDEDGDVEEAAVALVLADLLAKYARDELYGDLTSEEKAGVDSVIRDIHEVQGYLAVYLWPPSSAKIEISVDDAMRERLMAKLKADGFTTMDEHEREMRSRWFGAVYSGSELQMVVENRLCRKELWPLFAKIATFDFEHPERYGRAAGSK